MNIIISGYGKMGKEVETIALQRQHQIVGKFDQPGDWNELELLARGNPTVIDFSHPAAVEKNILLCFRYGIPIVAGTTGWNKQLPGIIKTCREGNHALLTAPNFSIGMNIFFALNKYLASLMNNHEDFEVSVKERHHVNKIDKPSGTAISLAGQIIHNLQRKKEWKLGDLENDHQLAIESVREGEVFGDHEVNYESKTDSILIRHSAKSRQGLALGAVMAAEWLEGKTGYFEMHDFLGF